MENTEDQIKQDLEELLIQNQEIKEAMKNFIEKNSENEEDNNEELGMGWHQPFLIINS